MTGGADAAVSCQHHLLYVHRTWIFRARSVSILNGVNDGRCLHKLLEESVGGWLETSDWDHFDAWLYSRAPVYQDEGYFAGEGAQDMTEAELIELSNWAETVHAGLSN